MNEVTEMNEKKLYIWRLGAFLHTHGKTMSAAELADHLNRNQFKTSYGSHYEGGRGTYTLIQETWKWVHDDLGLDEEAHRVAMAYVKPDGTHAWDKD